ncbi:hypothetical protein LCGC14_3030850 [marine sediment metagenome]|uniref:Uncharacterized protein n=1 Tax=marine sediment metagenome TaxID=412755 RepID=A0A0F8XFM7_9ZZZZ
MKDQERTMHRTEEILIKTAKVDKNIISIVHWLNAFESVHTVYSCEGADKQRPYVIFVCMEVDDLYDICKVIQDFERDNVVTIISGFSTIQNDIKIEAEVFGRILRYHLCFSKTNARKRFSNFLLSKKT